MQLQACGMTSAFVGYDSHILNTLTAPPNSCDGTYNENCDPSRDYDISQVRNFADVLPGAGSR